jgi:hypothetical protein
MQDNYCHQRRYYQQHKLKEAERGPTAFNLVTCSVALIILDAM